MVKMSRVMKWWETGLANSTLVKPLVMMRHWEGDLLFVIDGLVEKKWMRNVLKTDLGLPRVDTKRIA